MKIIETANQNEPNRARRIANMKLSGDLTCSGYDVQWLVARLLRWSAASSVQWRRSDREDRLAIQAR
jgi:hypothetical protein